MLAEELTRAAMVPEDADEKYSQMVFMPLNVFNQ